MDLNSDLGESFGAWRMGDDAAMLRIVTSANIACGFHAGDPQGLLRVLEQAKAHGTAVGAHIGYRDLAGFGRRDMAVAPADLKAETLYQIGALQALARAAGTRVTYVKPHGALYNRMAHDLPHADAVIDGILALDPQLALMVLAGSPLVAHAQARGLRVISEVFADRAYRPDGSLQPRGEEGATLHDPAEIARRMIDFARTGRITACDGTSIQIAAQSICVHGDNAQAVEIARHLRHSMEAEGIALSPVHP